MLKNTFFSKIKERKRTCKIIMNFYSPVSNTRCHSIGHKMRIAKIKIRVSREMGQSLGRERNIEGCVLSLEWNIGRENEFRV